MSDAFQPNLDFSAADAAAEGGEAFVVDLEGFEGPLHVLLALARTQKVDLLSLSITKLAEQYLVFVHEARRRNFALAADYLVMASWLAYLKSRLLLPKPERKVEGEPPAEVMAQQLAFRLMKLEAMRKAVDTLTKGPQLGRDVFGRGDPEQRVVLPSNKLDASLYDLMSAYVSQRRREAERSYSPTQRVEAFPLEEARDWMMSQLPRLSAWTELTRVAPKGHAEGEGPSQTSCLASTFSASLELVKEGRLEAKQLDAFDPLFVKSRRDVLVLEPEQ